MNYEEIQAIGNEEGWSIGKIFDRYIIQQGWNETSQVIILRRWAEEVVTVRMGGHDRKLRFIAFLQESADIENSP